ncbi:hypothetical protein ACFSQD_15925 [Flavihumibacter stibioxidans]|nr:hypothetical protein [Flavihumibacter stibioxidans]
MHTTDQHERHYSGDECRLQASPKSFYNKWIIISILAAIWLIVTISLL